MEYSPDLKLDIYYPPGPAPKGGFPVFLYYHGGGWRYGDRKRDVPMCTVQVSIHMHMQIDVHVHVHHTR